MTRVTLITLLLCTACAHGQVRNEPARTPDGKFIVELTEQEQKLMPKWLEYDCGVAYKKPGQYQKCVATITNSLPPLDPTRREHFGEQYDPDKYYKCRLATQPSEMSCNVHGLRRAENPAFWPYPDVPLPKLPEPPNPPIYKEGMTPKQYFEALCKAEAGDFIYKIVEDVEGIYQIRPQEPSHEGGDDRTDRYVMEDPYGYRIWLADGPQSLFVYKNKHYEFFETSAAGRISDYAGRNEIPDPATLGPNPSARFYRYVDTPEVNRNRHKREARAELASRYGYLWRGISRAHDRELAIAGGELVILDLKTNEILAVHRGFNLNGNARNSRTGIYWGSGPMCPMQKDYDFVYLNFIKRVLKPKQSATN